MLLVVGQLGFGSLELSFELGLGCRRLVKLLLENSGFELERLETGEFRDEPHPEYGWVRHLLKTYWLATELRGDGIYALGRKTGPVRDRYPGWLYS